MKNHLTTQLWNLLTKEEIADGVVNITYDCGISTDIKIGSSMVDKLMDKSPWRDHIIGFKRDSVGIDLVLDEEGQAKWNDKVREIQNGVTNIDATIEVVDGIMVVSSKVEKFEPKDGDVVSIYKKYRMVWMVAIYKKEQEDDTASIYCQINGDGRLSLNISNVEIDGGLRPATEEEKQQLFDKLAEEGYEWKPDTKELVKLKWKPKTGDAYWYPSANNTNFTPLFF